MTDRPDQPGTNTPQTPPVGEPGSPRAGSPAPSPIDAIQAQMLTAQIIEVLRTIYDPEIPVNIYDLGLVYGIDVESEGHVTVRMTLTSPMCPVAGSLPGYVRDKVLAIDGVNYCEVELVWDPPWDQSKLSEEARLRLGLL